MNKNEKMYYFRFSVSAYGEDGIEQLKAFREKLDFYQEKKLSLVYRDFDMVPSSVKAEDMVIDVGHIRVTPGERPYGFFFISTKTLGMKHFSFWKDVCKQYYPDVFLDVIGDREDGQHYCESLLMPHSREQSAATEEVE